MALALFDRVQETTTTAGTGPLTLLGAVDGFQSFAVVGNTNTCYYTVVDGLAWEVGIGTYSTTGPTLARTTVLSNSNADTSPITLSSSVNTKTVFLTYPAEKSVNLDASGNVSPLGTIASGTWQGTTVGVGYGGTGVTASSGANSVVLRDADQNTAVNRVNQNFQKIVAAGGTTILTVASPFYTQLVGSSTQDIQLPDATTLANGTTFLIDNDTANNVNILDGSGAFNELLVPGGFHYLTLGNNATVAGTWLKYSLIPSEVEWGTNSLQLSTTVVSGGTWQGGTIQSGYGGTGLTTFSAANNALYSTGASTLTAGTLPVLAGGTGSTTASGARSNLSAAASGANSDITSLSGLTTPLSVGQGGTGLSTLTANRIPYGNGTSAFNSSVNFTYDGTYLLVGDSGGLGGATNPVIASVGTADNYVQSYVYNTTTGGSASADFVAYPHNGSDASGWIDIGITSIDFDDATFSVTGPNEPYLFGSSPSTAGTAVTGNLVYATDGYGSTNYHQWYVGGFNQLKSAWKMQLTSTGLQLANPLGTAYGGTGNTTGQAASVANAVTFNNAGGGAASGTTFNGSTAVTVSYNTIGAQPAGTYVTAVSGTSPVASSGGTTPAISLASGYGDTQNPYDSKTANYFLAAPNGSAGAPTFRAIVAADVPTLNQNTTGTAAGLSSTLAVGSGGTGATTLTANNVIIGNGTSAVQFVAPGTSGNVLTSNGTTWVSSASAAGGFPSGTIMLFRQTAAPTGWTKDTTNYNDSALRVVTGSISSGGSVGFTTAFASQAVSGSIANTTAGGSVSISGGAVSAFTLTTTEMPSHTHTIYGNLAAPNTAPYAARTLTAVSSSSNVTSASTGGGSSHTHGFTNPSGSFTGTAHNHTFTGTAINMAVKYCDVIFATKD